MNIKIKQFIPYILIILSVFVLYYGFPIPAGACFMVGVILVIEQIWPEEWEAEKNKDKR